jgi:tRNA U38,U39,U40 pseudouridine synthase TruA
MVGVMAACGCGNLALDQIRHALAESSTFAAPLTAPASGLFLERVFYRGDRRDFPLAPVAMCGFPAYNR